MGLRGVAKRILFDALAVLTCVAVILGAAATYVFARSQFGAGLIGAVILPAIGLLRYVHKRLFRPLPALPIRPLREWLAPKPGEERPQRFRDFGPRWVDFEAETNNEQFIYHRREAKEMFGRLVRAGNRRLLLDGPPGSGKSVIAWDVGYQLSRLRWRPWDVFYHALKTAKLEDKTAHTLVDGLNDYPGPALLIVDDVHLDICLAERILREVKNPKVSLLVISQPQFERYRVLGREERHPLRQHCDYELPVDSTVGFEELAKWGLRLGLGRDISKEEMQELRKECGHDLLFLSRYLRNLEIDEAGKCDIVSMREDVYRKTEEDFKHLEMSTGEQSPELLLLVSTFFQYGIGVAPQPFLTDKYGYARWLIDELVREGHLREEDSAQRGRLLTLYHESLAKLYLKAAEERGFFWLATLKDKFKPWPSCLFGEYILTVPLNAIQFANELPARELAKELYLGRRLTSESVFRQVFSKSEVRLSLTKSLCYAGAEDIGRCLSWLHGSDAAWAKEVWDAPGVQEAIVEAVKRADALGIGWCLRLLCDCDPLWGRWVWETPGVEDAVVRAVKRGDAEGIGLCLHFLHDWEPAWANTVWLTPGMKEAVVEAMKRAPAFSIGFSFYHLHKCNPGWPKEVGDAPGVRQAAVEALKRADALGIIRCLTALLICDVGWGLEKEPGLMDALCEVLKLAGALELIFGLVFLLDGEVLQTLPEEHRSALRELEYSASEWKRRNA